MSEAASEKAASVAMPEASSAAGRLEAEEFSSTDSLSRPDAGQPFCRICHLSGDPSSRANLLSPCRCAGTLQYVHAGCLAKWIHASARMRRSMPAGGGGGGGAQSANGRRPRGRRAAPRCELCRYEFRRKARLGLAANGGWRCPRVSRGDRVLHLIFLLCVVIMLSCAAITVMCFMRDRERSRYPHAQRRQQSMLVLTGYEALTLASGILFFLAFFTAMSVQIKSRRTVYRLLVKCYQLNVSYSFKNYAKDRDCSAV